MQILFNNNLPIYLQIINAIKKQIIIGELKAGDKLPSVRELAAELNINPNTIQRAFQELEREGVASSQRGMGRYVTEEQEKIMDIKREMSKDILDSFIREMRSLGLSKEEIIKIIKLRLEELSDQEV